ncbi:hypothetical protein UCRPA7_645 [Phaeoacremonium minimum UCRPA7]|uniref:Uncharacterized protein n=1 Tax=Phaeoacremonium minimum (strain UCR-PA7) TaxID=1286976 RepID=R8BX78_PHAM7|nr:hypothetical protein UCRPA7_645 [Phaeoacremonium minimum UCRPA7]EOO04006.1 hypothetical protein UCRPA7_645 [Phaeoacremonium minimum UCRPA7]
MSGPPRKRQDHSGDNDNNYFEVKRVRLTDGTAILPKSETVTIREEHYLRMNEHISHLRSACSKKHRQVGEMDKRIASMGRVIRKRDTDIAEKNRIIADKSKFNNALQLVNEESQVKIHILKDDNAKLQKELNSVRAGNGWTGWLVNHGRCSTTQAAYESWIQELEQRDKAQKAELVRKDQEFAAARVEFTREMREARDLSSHNTFKVPDNVILDGWKELTFKIHQFVDYHLFAYPISDLSDDAIQSYRPLCPEPAMFLTNVLLAPLLFEAGIWSCLDKLVFGVTAEGWAGKLGRDYSQSCRNIREVIDADSSALNDYHDWRSRYAQLLEKLSPVSKKDLKMGAKKMADSILRFQPDADRLAAEHDLREILADATDLNMMLRKSKAEFIFTFDNIDRKDSINFNPSRMQLRNLFGLTTRTSSSIPRGIDLVISPALEKRGTSDGDKYDLQTMLIKPEVVCNVSVELAKQEDDNVAFNGQAGVCPKQEQDNDEVILVKDTSGQVSSGVMSHSTSASRVKSE